MNLAGWKLAEGWYKDSKFDYLEISKATIKILSKLNTPSSPLFISMIFGTIEMYGAGYFDNELNIYKRITELLLTRIGTIEEDNNLDDISLIKGILGRIANKFKNNNSYKFTISEYHEYCNKYLKERDATIQINKWMKKLLNCGIIIQHNDYISFCNIFFENYFYSIYLTSLSKDELVNKAMVANHDDFLSYELVAYNDIDCKALLNVFANRIKNSFKIFEFNYKRGVGIVNTIEAKDSNKRVAICDINSMHKNNDNSFKEVSNELINNLKEAVKDKDGVNKSNILLIKKILDFHREENKLKIFEKELILLSKMIRSKILMPDLQFKIKILKLVTYMFSCLSFIYIDLENSKIEKYLANKDGFIELANKLEIELPDDMNNINFTGLSQNAKVEMISLVFYKCQTLLLKNAINFKHTKVYGKLNFSTNNRYTHIMCELIEAHTNPDNTRKSIEKCLKEANSMKIYEDMLFVNMLCVLPTINDSNDKLKIKECLFALWSKSFSFKKLDKGRVKSLFYNYIDKLILKLRKTNIAN